MEFRGILAKLRARISEPVVSKASSSQGYFDEELTWMGIQMIMKIE